MCYVRLEQNKKKKNHEMLTLFANKCRNTFKYLEFSTFLKLPSYKHNIFVLYLNFSILINY